MKIKNVTCFGNTYILPKEIDIDLNGEKLKNSNKSEILLYVFLETMFTKVEKKEDNEDGKERNG